MRPLPHQHQRVLDGARQVEVGRLQFHPSRLDLGQIEDVVDEGQEMSSRLQNVAEVFRLLVVDLAEHPLGQDLREADDGVERRAQLVRHVGEELALVPARDLELPALVSDLTEEPCILNGERRLCGECLEQIDHLRREFAGSRSIDDETTEQVIFAQERHRQQRAVSRAQQHLPNAALVDWPRPRCRESAPLRRSPRADPAHPRPSGWGSREARRRPPRAAGRSYGDGRPRALRRTRRSILRPCRRARWRARRSCDSTVSRSSVELTA